MCFFLLNYSELEVLWVSADRLYIQAYDSKHKVVWSCGLGVKFLMVCHCCRSKSSLWVAHLNIQT